MMFSVSGLRGLVNEDLTPDIIHEYAYTFGLFLGPGKIVLGRDTRKSSEPFQRAVIKGLNKARCMVVDLGIVPTPTVLCMVKQYKAKGGIAITASHNPEQWNALKFIGGKGRFLNTQEFRKFSSLLRKLGQSPIANKKAKSRYKMVRKGVDQHIDKIVNELGMVRSNFRVGVDAVNGAGSKALPKLLKAMGCKVYCINCRFDHKFPRGPEPIPKNLSLLCGLVREKKLHIGVACDPDCDRLAIVNEEGKAIGEDKTLVLATDYILEKVSGNVVTNLSTTALMEYITKKYRGRLFRVRVGEAHVVKKMIETKALIGGEGNGGVIFPAVNFTRDALIGAAIVLKMMDERKTDISRIIASYPKYHIKKIKLKMNQEDFQKKKKKLIRVIPGRLSQTDGIRISKNDLWVHIRPSQTEPLVRIIGEAVNKQVLESCLKKVLATLH